MRSLAACLCLLAAAFLIAACSTQRPLPAFQPPIVRAAVQNVRMTAYTHTESDHRQHGRRTALGTTLRHGSITSAAADWSRWPAGTVFRIRETGDVCEVDDYGWALAGTNTIDLYRPSRASMNTWGVRRVNIEILRWGDAWASYATLEPRAKHRHVERMLKQIRQRYARRSQPDEPVVARVAVAGPAAPWASAAATAAHQSTGGVAGNPFFR